MYSSNYDCRGRIAIAQWMSLLGQLWLRKTSLRVRLRHGGYTHADALRWLRELRGSVCHIPSHVIACLHHLPCLKGPISSFLLYRLIIENCFVSGDSHDPSSCKKGWMAIGSANSINFRIYTNQRWFRSASRLYTILRHLAWEVLPRVRTWLRR